MTRVFFQGFACCGICRRILNNGIRINGRSLCLYCADLARPLTDIVMIPKIKKNKINIIELIEIPWSKVEEKPTKD